MIEREIVVGETVEILGNDAHHISKVLRLSVGDWIVLSDGHGSRFRCKIAECGKKSVLVNVKELLPSLNLTDLTLAQAITKHDKLEFIIQKAVELGVTKIIPFTSKRTIPKFSDNVSEAKLERWNKIAIEAAKQCGMPIKPIVKPLTNFNELIDSSKDLQAKLMFYEGEELRTLKEYFGATVPQSHSATEKNNRGTAALQHRGTIILIGPEGGFTAKEVALAKEAGFATIKLGPLIMRVETAAISAITLTQYFHRYFD